MEFKFVNIDYVIVAIFVVFFLAGVLGGFFKRASKIVGFIGAISLTYFLGGYILDLILKIEEVDNWVKANNFGHNLILIGGYIALFFAFFLIIFLLLKILKPLFSGGPLRNFVNGFLGGIFGIFTGLLISSIYLLVTYFIAQNNDGVNTRYLENFGYNENIMTLSRYILEFSKNLFGIN